MKKGLGLALIVIAIAAGAAYMRFFAEKPPAPESPERRTVETVFIRYGSEKKGLLGDPDVQAIFRDRYGVVVDGTRMGSLEMSEGSIDGIDALWPSSELAGLVFESRHPGVAFKKHNAFSTPIVFFSWPEITDALINAAIVEKRDNVHYIIDLKKYLDGMIAKQTWKSLGLKYQNGILTIRSTDPRKSNSGFLLSGLLAIVLNGGDMVDADSMADHIPRLAGIFKSMGYMENSSGILFDKYVKQGQGAYPLISNYESLMIEFYKAYPDKQEQIRKMIRVLIPEPTVWSDHPLIALTPKGEKLMAALQDGDVLRIAWERFGFRSGMMGIGLDTGILKDLGLPDRIRSVTPLPSARAMDQILAALE